jgi:hypothetical protein
MAISPLTGQDIIDKFELYTGDTTELSTQDELYLVNKIYGDVCNDRPWEWLKKTATGTITVTNGVATITPPADFLYFVENSQATNIAYETQNNASPKVIFLATATGLYDPYQIINFSDRRQFLNQVGYAYLDTVNNLITFTKVPTETDLTYEFDYIYTPPAITLTTSPVFPALYHDIIFHGMAVDDMIIQLFDREKTYAKENQAGYDSMMTKLRYYNAQLQMQ